MSKQCCIRNENFRYCPACGSDTIFACSKNAQEGLVELGRFHWDLDLKTCEQEIAIRLDKGKNRDGIVVELHCETPDSPTILSVFSHQNDEYGDSIDWITHHQIPIIGSRGTILL